MQSSVRDIVGSTIFDTAETAIGGYRVEYIYPPPHFDEVWPPASIISVGHRLTPPLPWAARISRANRHIELKPVLYSPGLEAGFGKSASRAPRPTQSRWRRWRSGSPLFE